MTLPTIGYSELCKIWTKNCYYYNSFEEYATSYNFSLDTLTQGELKEAIVNGRMELYEDKEDNIKLLSKYLGYVSEEDYISIMISK